MDFDFYVRSCGFQKGWGAFEVIIHRSMRNKVVIYVVGEVETTL